MSNETSTQDMNEQAIDEFVKSWRANPRLICDLAYYMGRNRLGLTEEETEEAWRRIACQQKARS